LRVACIRCVGGRPTVQEAIARLLEWTAAREGLGIDPACLMLVHDDPAVTPRERMRVDACVTVSRRRRGEGPIAIRTIPLAAYAVVTCNGTNAASMRVREWVARAAAAMGKSVRLEAGLEVILGDVEAASGAWLTDVLVPLDERPPSMRPYFRRRRVGSP
jgi:AraC family transcriptional regulator